MQNVEGQNKEGFSKMTNKFKGQEAEDSLAKNAFAATSVAMKQLRWLSKISTLKINFVFRYTTVLFLKPQEDLPAKPSP